jgi:glycosyltransferase involved in cell wall biosynthesis
VSRHQPLQVSVVIGVRDGGEQILRTIDVVCAQRDVSVECIVVDDGSSDATGDKVAALARVDPRVRLFRPRRAGVTRALIAGCAEARAPLIARIDAGDQMLGGRLARQCEVLHEHPWIHLLRSQYRELGPDDEVLPSATAEQAGQITDLSAQQRSAKVGSLSGIAHFCVCFRSETDQRGGGSRAQFEPPRDCWRLFCVSQATFA